MVGATVGRKLEIPESNFRQKQGGSLSRDRTIGNGPALFVSCLFALVVVATLRWRAQATVSPSPRPDESRVIDLLPQRVGAEIRAADVLRSQDTELARTAASGRRTSSATWRQRIKRPRPPQPFSRAFKNAEQPDVQAVDFPEFNLLKDEAYQRSRAQALANRVASIPDLPAMRSPALSKIFRELHMREMKKRPAAMPGPAAAVGHAPKRRGHRGST